MMHWVKTNDLPRKLIYLCEKINIQAWLGSARVVGGAQDDSELESLAPLTFNTFLE